MPLKFGSKESDISYNVKEIMHSYKTKGAIGASKPKSDKKAKHQALAIAYMKARNDGVKKDAMRQKKRHAKKSSDVYL